MPDKNEHMPDTPFAMAHTSSAQSAGPSTAIVRARALLYNLTPLKTDCGRLCANACCQGDGETGMLLFPGEEALYAGCQFGRVVPTHFKLAGRQALLFVCDGHCPREMRPLACRLFPLFLHIDARGNARVKLDSRAQGVCPLCGYGMEALDPAFLSAATQAYDLLMEDDACRAYLRALSEAFDL